MTRLALFFALLLVGCASTPSTDAAPADAQTDATAFETSAESAVPPLPDLDARADG